MLRANLFPTADGKQVVPTSALVTRASLSLEGKLPTSKFDRYLDKYVQDSKECVSQGLPKLGTEVYFADVPHKSKNRLADAVGKILGYVPHAFDRKEVLVCVWINHKQAVMCSLYWLTVAESGEWLSEMYKTDRYTLPRRRNRKCLA